MTERPAEGATHTGAGPLGRRPPQEGPQMARPSAPWWSERHAWSSRLEMTGTDARSARQGFNTSLRRGSALLRPTLTDDRGKERANTRVWPSGGRSRDALSIPHSPWPHGTHEHTTRLLRQYRLQGMDLSGYTQRELYAHRLTTRPQTCVNVAMPLKVSAQLRHHLPVALRT